MKPPTRYKLGWKVKVMQLFFNKMVQYCSCFLSNPAICRAGSLCCCVIHVCCHSYNAAATAVRISSAAECGREFHLLLRCILSTAVNIIPLRLYCCVLCVTRACTICAVYHAWSFKLCFCRQSLALCGRGHLRRERHNKEHALAY